MLNSYDYISPIGKINIIASENYLVGLYFINQKYYQYKINEEIIYKKNQVIEKTIKWLDNYFKGMILPMEISLSPKGTDYQLRVYDLLKKIPFKDVKTYKDIKNLYEKTYNTKTSCRAIGNAISKNPISIIIPCHRVIGSNNNLTGYAGGLDKKKWLLNFEKSK